ncbi:bifunctional 2-C-methyl-D-erythritol 4-phosphate cytidylyltransferase/2-C-methyl-D-erythritol 2,4-cyclodiphosphate synthase [Hyphobacterium marinum]|uniref:Bifunctional enzyme IspD/IspF n=1 Tax=Hyphobacterium marinum TaxID=3116574 RepID=A0ABU7LYF5_9PROT|nr:bifunctional 2-C-methyl-D-erythritol 4-phosphate cytidylyltransferase/2-C-methyl-D-erythritol 2,4-cyclodiphosphate synthase [Hyphobacterium sp. Y6023]MEE2566584.1 bifunctional 2-C-methyl-D-erythritol 4-phosphate cytidylyltransferase/2-C-methyl-D-erythritol 2,4-cyclodiphosphate synthase [Hyphobacterium sp. Y6023]
MVPKEVEALSFAVIIVAAGGGTRAGGPVPKQFRTLGGRPMLHHTIGAFATHPEIGRIVLVSNPAHRDRLGALPLEVIHADGGPSRTASVRAGLAVLSETPPDLVLIHDAARPLVSTQVISGVLDGLRSFDAAIPALPVTDALTRRDADGAFEPVSRDGLFRVQTPQGFHFPALWAAYQALPDDADLPDDAAVAKRAGMTLTLTAGDEENLKVTFPDDFDRAEERLERRRIPVTGSGFDVHRLEAGDSMMLGGVQIAAGLSLIGHSDADVVLHALTDAILGCCGQGDIGQHFPPSDPQWKGRASSAFVEHAMTLAAAAGVILTHVDLTIICERPKIGPHRDAIRARVAGLTGLGEAAVNIKATTTEGLGFTGRGEGITAQALVSGWKDAS